MFILFGDRRINLELIKQYKPLEKSSSYLIELIYLDGSKEDLYFFDRKDERNEYLDKLDKNLLINLS